MDALKLCREANDKTTRTQNDVGRRLGDRIGDIEYWKTEVYNETGEMMTEIDALNRAKLALEKMIADIETPLHISQECLYNREKRQGIDLVHDDVERALIKVRDVLAQRTLAKRRCTNNNNNNNNPLDSFADKPLRYASQQLTRRTALINHYWHAGQVQPTTTGLSTGISCQHKRR